MKSTNHLEKNKKIFDYLDQHYPSVGCELTYQKDYQLLIAVVLSAQTTDKAVNKVTPILFTTYPTLEALSTASVESIEQCIQSIGLYKDKAKHVLAIAQQLIKSFQGIVPSNKEVLLSLPGVGIKTANVVRAELFRIPEIAVDTHVYRIARRLGFSKPKDSLAVTEKKLKKIVPVDKHILFHHQLIHFGRYFCKAVNPTCDGCGLVDVCLEKKKNLKKQSV
jgi:endonuclease III